MQRVGHGKLALTRYVTSNFPQIEVEVDVFQTEENELKFFYNPERSNQNFLTIELQGLPTSTNGGESD